MLTNEWKKSKWNLEGRCIFPSKQMPKLCRLARACALYLFVAHKFSESWHTWLRVLQILKILQVLQILQILNILQILQILLTGLRPQKVQFYLLFVSQIPNPGSGFCLMSIKYNPVVVFSNHLRVWGGEGRQKGRKKFWPNCIELAVQALSMSCSWWVDQSGLEWTQVNPSGPGREGLKSPR